MSDYKRAYKFVSKAGHPEYLFEVQVDGTIWGCDAGYIEADWKIVDRNWDSPSEFANVDYHLYTGWSNDGPRMDYELEPNTADEDNPYNPWTGDGWQLREGWELITDYNEVVAFAKTRPGLYAELEDDLRLQYQENDA